MWAGAAAVDGVDARPREGEEGVDWGEPSNK